MADILISDSTGKKKRLRDMGDGTYAEVLAVAPSGLNDILNSLPPKIVYSAGALSYFEVSYGGKTYRQTITYPDANTMTVGAWTEVV